MANGGFTHSPVQQALAVQHAQAAQAAHAMANLPNAVAAANALHGHPGVAAALAASHQGQQAAAAAAAAAAAGSPHPRPTSTPSAPSQSFTGKKTDNVAIHRKCIQFWARIANIRAKKREFSKQAFTWKGAVPESSNEWYDYILTTGKICCRHKYF